MISVQTCQQGQLLCGPPSGPVFGVVVREVFTADGGRAASRVSPSEEEPPGDVGDDTGGGAGDEGTLEDVARREREYLRGRVREELGREPTEAELDEWLREHTEGH